MPQELIEGVVADLLQQVAIRCKARDRPDKPTTVLEVRQLLFLALFRRKSLAFFTPMPALAYACFDTLAVSILLSSAAAKLSRIGRKVWVKKL